MPIDKPRVTLIDLSSLFWAAWHVHNENGVQEARTATLAGVKRCLGEGNDLVAIACDSGTSFRKSISDTYKANRDKQPAASYGELNKTKDRLRADGFLLWECPSFEADDILATATKKARDLGHEVRVCSADSDLLSLADVRTDVLRVHTWEIWTSRTITEKLLIDAEQMTDFKALVGDKSDNIAGAPGIGKIRAAELLTKFETLDRIYEALDAGKQVSTPANEKSLRENREQVMLSRDLVRLRFDAPIEFEQIYAERRPQSLTGENDMTDEPELPDDPKGDGVVQSVSVSEDSTPHTTAVSAPASNGPTVPAATALVNYAPPAEFERQLEPMSIAGAFKLARGLFDSRLYSRFPNPEAIMAVIIRGREMGLGAMTALDSFHVIEGRPVPHAYLMVARAKEHPDCEYLYCKETNAETSTWITKNRRNPEPTSLTYTFAQAKASGLVQPAQEKTGRDGSKYMAKANQWVVRPAEMLRKTCAVQLARMEYPSATMGLYADIELGADDYGPDVTP